MNFITEKIQYDDAREIFWTRLFYSAEGREATAYVGATKSYLYELFKKTPDVELTKSYQNTWLKIAMRELAPELPRTNTDEPYYKMYAVNPEEIRAGIDFLKSLS